MWGLNTERIACILWVKNNGVKRKKIKPTLILEEAEEAKEDKVEDKVENKVENKVEDKVEDKVENIVIEDDEVFEIIPVKRRQTKKHREQKLKVNPPGKRGTKRLRKLPDDVEIVDE